jgi:hypothetical protein
MNPVPESQAPSAAASSRVPKRAAASIILVALPLAPSLLLEPLGLGAATGMFVLGAVAGLVAAVLVSGRFGIAMAVVLAAANFLALPVADSIVLAGLVMAAVSLLYGLTARRGISAAVVMAPQSVAFTLADPPQVVAHGSLLANAAAVGLVALVGGLWGAGAGSFIGRKVPHIKPRPESLRHAVMFGVTIAVVTGVAMAVVVAMQLQHGGAWLILTLLLVLQPDVQRTWKKSIERVWGTTLGFAIAFAIGLLVHQHAVLLAVGLLFIAGAVYVQLDSKRSYWQFTMVLTPGIVLVEGAGSGVLETDLARLWFTLVGAAIALGIAGLVRWSKVR